MLYKVFFVAAVTWQDNQDKHDNTNRIVEQKLVGFQQILWEWFKYK